MNSIIYLFSKLCLMLAQEELDCTVNISIFLVWSLCGGVGAGVGCGGMGYRDGPMPRLLSLLTVVVRLQICGPLRTVFKFLNKKELLKRSSAGLVNVYYR